jgi:hypothetical protein
MFEKDDKGIQLALSVSPEKDAQILGHADRANVEGLHRLATQGQDALRPEFRR